MTEPMNDTELEAIRDLWNDIRTEQTEQTGGMDMVPVKIDLFDQKFSKLVADRNRLRAERDAYKKAKAENDERFMLERDEARAQLEQQESVNAGLRRAYEHACEQRDKYMRRTVEWRQAATHGGKRR